MLYEVITVAVENKMAVVAIVGEGMKHTAGVSGQLFQNVGKNGINVYAIAHVITSYSIHYTKLYEGRRRSVDDCRYTAGPHTIEGVEARQLERIPAPCSTGFG